MSLINCKVESKLRWTKNPFLALAGAGNDGANSNNIIFTVKNTKIHIPVVFLSPKDNQKLPQLFNRDFERSVYWNEYKTKSEFKNSTNECRYFPESNFVGVNRLC